MSIGDEDVNVDDFKDSIIDDTLDTLGNQTDDEGIGELYESLRINPQAFNVSGVTSIIQHVDFKTPFDGLPVVTFGQSSSGENSPFIALPYVHKWTYTNGMVDGFDMGIYSITPPPGGVDTHYISWRAIGKASRAGQQGTEQSWTDPYTATEPDFLVADSEDSADEGEDVLSDPIDSDNYPY